MSTPGERTPEERAKLAKQQYEEAERRAELAKRNLILTWDDCARIEKNRLRLKRRYERRRKEFESLNKKEMA